MKASLYITALPVAVAASCTASDQHTLAHMDVNDIGKKANDCGAEAYSMFTGDFSRDTFNTCFTKKVSISDSCSECYAASGEYGAKNCKAACLLGWCKQGCLDCTAPASKKVEECVGKGVQFEPITPCLEAEVGDVSASWEPGTCEPNPAIGQPEVHEPVCSKIANKWECNSRMTNSRKNAKCIWASCQPNPAIGQPEVHAPVCSKITNKWECNSRMTNSKKNAKCMWAFSHDVLALEAGVGDVSLSWEPGTCKPNPVIGQPEVHAPVCSEITDKIECNSRMTNSQKNAKCVWEADADAEEYAPVLVNPASGKCLDVHNPDGLAPKHWADETQVTIFRCNGAQGQEWILRDGSLVNPASGKCLDIYNHGVPAQDWADETNVQLSTCKGSANQQWALVNHGPNQQHLMNLPSGKCLDIFKGNLDDDTRVQLFTCGGDKANQHWRFAQSSQEEMMV